MNYELPTKSGKTIKLNVAQIEVSANDLIKTGMFIDIKLKGILPGCRKSQVLTYNFCTHNGVNISTLWGYRKFHEVSYEEMKKMIEQLPITTPSYAPYPITPELIKAAREDRIAMYGTKG